MSFPPGKMFNQIDGLPFQNRKKEESQHLRPQRGAYLLPIFADIVIGVPGHDGQELQEAVERVAVAGR